MKRTTKKQRQAKLNPAREKALNQTFEEIVQTIQNYMLVSPMSFLHGNYAQQGEYVFKDYDLKHSVFEGWIEQWMGTLYPRTLKYQENTEYKPDDDTLFFQQDLMWFGFVLGYLVGCSSMGASREQLLEKAHGYVVNELGITHYPHGQDAL